MSERGLTADQVAYLHDLADETRKWWCHLPDWVRQSPANVSEQLRDLQERVASLESRRHG
jgi:hypothetical protein